MQFTSDDRIDKQDSVEEKLKLLRSIARSSGEPFMLCDLSVVYDRVCMWKEHLPRIHPFYAVKCNDDPKVLKLLAQLAIGFDCASKGEISKVMDLGVGADRIIYANPCKQISHLAYAASRDVSLMTFDSEGEVSKIKRAFKNPQLVLRIAIDDSHSIIPLGIKFGAPLSHCAHLLRVAREAGCPVVGVSFHVGSGCGDANAYENAIKDSATVLGLAEKLGHIVYLLDIGGGFPGTADCSSTFAEIARVVNQSVDRHILPHWPDIRLVAEPGRFLVTPAFTLATAVVAVKQPEPGHEHIAPRCYVNDGLYGALNVVVWDHAKLSPKPLMQSCEQIDCDRERECDRDRDRDRERECEWSVWGPSCDSQDRVSSGSLLPATIQPGDWLYWENMGAYSLSCATSFNGFPTPELHYCYSNPQM